MKPRKSFHNPQPSRPVRPFTSLLKLICQRHKYVPAQPLPVVTPDWEEFHRLEPALIWLGHSSLLLRLAGLTLAIDPVFSKYAAPLPIFAKRFQPPPLSLEQLPPIDLVLLSHSHYDHLDRRAIAFFKPLKTRFLVPLGLEKTLQRWGIGAERIEVLDWWQWRQFGLLTIHAVPSHHNSGRSLWDRNKSLWCGYVLSTAQLRIYHSADSGFAGGGHFREIGRRLGPFDLALVENGQYNAVGWPDNHLLPEETLQALQLLGTKRFMPIHWGAYALSPHRWQAPPDATVAAAEALGLQTLTPRLGQVFSLDTATDRWWQHCH